MESFGTRVKYLREQGGRTLKDFSELLGLSISYISQLEKDKKSPSEQTILNICRALGVNRKWLEDGEGSSDAGIEVRLYRKEDIRDVQRDDVIKDLETDPVLKEILWKGLHGTRTQRGHFKKLMELAKDLMHYRTPSSGTKREINRKDIERDAVVEMATMKDEDEKSSL
jgi:transcriptional regulator with XRE-family HTH domain